MDRSYTTLSVELFDVEYRDLKIWLRGHSRSLNLVPFKSFGTVSYLRMAVSVAFCEIFSVKEWYDLENRFVQDHWKWRRLIDRIRVPIRLP